MVPSRLGAALVGGHHLEKFDPGFPLSVSQRMVEFYGLLYKLAADRAPFMIAQLLEGVPEAPKDRVIVGAPATPSSPGLVAKYFDYSALPILPKHRS